MKRSTPWLIAVPVLVLLGVAAGLWAEHRYDVLARLGIGAKEDEATEKHEGDASAAAHADEGGAEEQAIEPVPTVRTVVAEAGEITQARDVFGSVVPRPGALVAAALHSEVIVKKVMVITEQMVEKDEPLCEVQSGPATLAELAGARGEVDSADQLVQAAREKQDANLGTRQELLQAEAAARAAKMHVAQIEATLPDKSGIVRAPAAGRVMDVHVQSGAIAPAGTTLVEILEGDAVMIELEVLPDDAALLAPQQTMPLEILGAQNPNATLTGTIAWLGGSVDPASHMVDVYLTAARDAAGAVAGVRGLGGLRLGEIIRGRIERKSSGHVIVPRAAVLPGEEGNEVFIVQDGHAKRAVVTLGLQNSKDVEITAGEVKPGDQVVILGNYELEDGMEVKVMPTAGEKAGEANPKAVSAEAQK